MTETNRVGGMRCIRVPGDKSITHRALMLAALADGRSRVRRPLDGADTRSTAEVLRLLGCPVPSLDAAELVIDGVGLRGMRTPADTLDCGNSGTTARLMLGVLAGQELMATLTGDASLRSRPMRRITTPLAAMGAAFHELEQPDRLPLRVTGGPLRAFDYASPQASAQVKSAVLLAGLVAGVDVSVSEPMLSRDHTERMLAGAGASLSSRTYRDGRVSVHLAPRSRLEPLDIDVPGDFSSAAFVMAHATLHGREPVRIAGVGVNPTRTGMLRVLRRMGARVRLENQRESGGEPVADIVVEPAQLRATVITAAEVPSLIDELPVIAMLAARADGTTVISGAAELRVKESDRIAAVVANLRAIGGDADEMPDGLVIRGCTARLAGSVACRHDHRIAMAFGILAAAEGTDVAIDNRAVVDVSYPGFWRMLEEVRAS